jgi:hypothetical protein
VWDIRPRKISIEIEHQPVMRAVDFPKSHLGIEEVRIATCPQDILDGTRTRFMGTDVKDELALFQRSSTRMEL